MIIRFETTAAMVILHATLMLTLLIGIVTMPLSAYGHDRPTGPIGKTRSAVIAKNGMAATSQPLATEAAIRVLRHGGNAVDAAIAANAVLAVVEPMSCGLGGDLFAIVWDSKTQKLYGLNASGRMPGKATIEHYQALGLKQIPTHGPLSWSIPGCVDGWEELRKRFGSLPYSDILRPAYEHADQGFPVSEVIAKDWSSAAAELAKIPTSAACFLPDGKAPKKGDVFRNPGMAKSLKTIAEHGRDAFYQGVLAKAIADYSQSVGGLVTLEDLQKHKSDWVEPVSTNYRGYDVWELPPNGQGIAVLQMLNLLEPYDLKALGHNSAKTLHLIIEAKKLAYEDRAKFYTDMNFSKVPVLELISKAYAKERGKSLDPNKANAHPEAGSPGQSDTIYLTVVDKDRNCVSFIQSNFHGFGSYHVVGDWGFPLQNRGNLLALDPKHANRLEPHKRPFHTIIPGFVTKNGKPWLSFGVMGGDMQPQGHVQVLSSMIDFNMDPQEAGDAARVRHLGSSEPTGVQATDSGIVNLESAIGSNTQNQLRAMGHRIENTKPGGYGGYQAIQIDLERGILIGGSDPRKDGCAIGY